MDVKGVLSKLHLSDAQCSKVKDGEMLSQTVDSTNERELAAIFACVVHCTPDQMEEIFLESFKKQETDPTITAMAIIQDLENPDFSKVKLEPNGDAAAKTYMHSKKGSDGLNMSKEEMAAYHACKSTADVEAALRNVLKERLLAYRQKGIEGIAPYERKSETYQPGKELKLKTEKLVHVKAKHPEFYKYLLEYPNHKPPTGIHEAFSWINFNIEDNPTLSLVHKIAYNTPGDPNYIFAQRHFYVSRGHNSLQGVGVAIECDDLDKGDSLMVYLSRTSTDQVSGWGGAAKRTIGAKIMAGRLAENFGRYKKVVEKK